MKDFLKATFNEAVYVLKHPSYNLMDKGADSGLAYACGSLALVTGLAAAVGLASPAWPVMTGAFATYGLYATVINAARNCSRHKDEASKNAPKP